MSTPHTSSMSQIQPPKPLGKHASTWGFTGILCGSLLVCHDAVALSPSLPIIEDSLHINTLQAYWVGVAYTLGSAMFLPLFEPALRPKALGINGVVCLFGSAIGPIMGGGFSGYVSWRWIFWITLPVNGIALLLVAKFLDIPVAHERRSSRGGVARALSCKNLDYVGAVLSVASLSSILVPITWGGVMYPWVSYHTLAPLILGLAGFGAWIVYEAMVPTYPILPLTILNDRTVVISLIATFAIGVLQFGLVFYLPLYYQIVKGYSALMSGVALLPETFLSGPATIVTGVLVSKIRKYKTIIIVGWTVMALGCGLLLLLDKSSSVPKWIFINVPAGIGIGILFPSTTTSAQAPVAEEHIAIASGLVAFVRAVGQALGIAIGNAMVQNIVKQRLLSSTSEVLQQNASLIAGDTAYPKTISAFLNQRSLERSELLEAYTNGLRGLWWLLFAIPCCCGILSLFLKDVDLGQIEQSKDQPPPSSNDNKQQPGPEEGKQPIE